LHVNELSAVFVAQSAAAVVMTQPTRLQNNRMLRPRSINADNIDVYSNKELSRPWRNN
jgi:hypothetical protein